MPPSPTNPRVYVEEIRSEVRQVSGVSTSVTAFIGAATRGPINTAVQVLGSSGTLAERLTDLAARLQQKVRAARPTNPAFRDFTATVSWSALVLTSGMRGAGSSVSVAPSAADTLATDLKLTASAGADASAAAGKALTLAGGTETPLDPANAYVNCIGSRARREGIYALKSADRFNLMVLAGVGDAGVLGAAAAYCRERRAILIVDPAQADTTPENLQTAIAGTTFPRTSHAAVYYPWLSIRDPRTGRLRTVPPSGTIAGVIARTDASRGVWKAPAGTEATLRGVQGVAYALTESEIGMLNPRAVNCIRHFPVYGPVAWGARTLEGDDQVVSEWKYIPVRRLALFLDDSRFRPAEFVVLRVRQLAGQA